MQDLRHNGSGRWLSFVYTPTVRALKDTRPHHAGAMDTTLKLLAEVLRRPPPSLEVSANEKQEYVRDNCWPFPDCSKGQLLGRGGFAVVWLASDRHGKKLAVKQIRRNQCGDEVARSEIVVAQLLGEGDDDLAAHPGQRHIVALLNAVEARQSLWLMQEYGGIPLSKMLFDTNGVNHRGARIYEVKHLPFLQILRKDDRTIKLLLVQLLLALDVLRMRNIVHSDLKPDNVLIDGVADGTSCPLRVRLCDFGSAFIFNGTKEHRSFATPEYMPPEALKMTSIPPRRVSSRRPTNFPDRQAKGSSWAFDMWSVGCLWLEILHGVPLWIPFECLLPSGRVVKSGLFGVHRRDPTRIVAQQESVVKKDLSNLWARLNWAEENVGLSLFQSMLCLRASQRISPTDALAHPFLEHY